MVAARITVEAQGVDARLCRIERLVPHTELRRKESQELQRLL